MMKSCYRTPHVLTIAAGLVAVLAFSAGLQAETPPAGTPRAGQFVNKYGIGGVVVGGKESKPLADVTLSLSYGAPDEGTQFSSSSGTFNFYPLEPGEYQLRAYYGNTKILCKSVRIPIMTKTGGESYPESAKMRIVFPEDPSAKQTLEQDSLVHGDLE